MTSTPTPSPTLKNPHWSPLLVTFVSVTCLIFLLFTYCKILKHCCTFQRLSTNRAPTRLLDEANNRDDPSLQFQSRGLDSCVMHSLPITRFTKKEEKESGESGPDCAVCLAEFEEGEWVKHLPNCSHVFHVSCIDIWFQTHSTCPLCRSCVSVSVYSLMETLRREDFVQDRSMHYQVVRSHILQTSSVRIDTQAS
ncbi:RING-H2 finger protein ATL16 [Camellia lanceoleosa]|uniref:RING-H2 finger protein ATL16 n=1 Tax=Camellia lanceoleosa TaxID=1840588 RepID=A0ACC0HQV0_9ERIC|nr:RING-H2 finger protein ATL16 [Camellia lanceoleosa]